LSCGGKLRCKSKKEVPMTSKVHDPIFGFILNMYCLYLFQFVWLLIYKKVKSGTVSKKNI
jgi:hypothetical protein